MIRVAAWIVVATIGGCSTSSAQNLLPGRLEIGGGVVWIGSTSAESRDATETTSSGGTSTIFKTSTSVAQAVGLRLHAGFRLTRAFELEGEASFSKPKLKTDISSDIENGAAVTATETITQYVFGGGVLYYVPFKRTSERVRLFVVGRAAYLRQLHESNTLIASGQMYQFGGGLKYFVPAHRASWVKGYGVRADVALAARTQGVLFDDAARFSPVVGGSVFVRF